jgi:serine/threonine protein kinase
VNKHFVDNYPHKVDPNWMRRHPDGGQTVQEMSEYQPPATQQMDRPQVPEQPKAKPPPSLDEKVAAARESVGGVIRAQIIAAEARLNKAKDQEDFERCVELKKSVQQLKQQLEQAIKAVEEKVRGEDAERIRKEAERKQREEVERRAQEEQARRAAEEQERKEAAARAKQAAERKAREEAEQQWSSFESVLQGEKSKAEKQLNDAVATKKFADAEVVQRRIEQLAQLRSEGEKLKQLAGPGQAEQQELKRRLEELSASIANRPQQSRLRGSEMDLLHVDPFDVDEDVPFSTAVQKELGINTSSNTMLNDDGMKVLYPVRVMKELSARTFKGRWTLHEIIGFGGSGVVVRATDSHLHREVALKIVTPQGPIFLSDEERRHAREKGAMQRVDHPNIVKFHESHYDASKRIYFMVMELAEGHSLAEAVQIQKFSRAKLLEVAISICEALHAMHEENIIHLDIKPQNIMFQESLIEGTQSIKLVDFGLAQASQERGETNTMMTKNESVAGTLLFMAPEQLEKKALDARTDIFAAGVTVYNLGCGHFPHRTACTSLITTVRELDSWESNPPATLDQHLPNDIDSAFGAIIAKAISPDPVNRFQSAAEMLPALQGLRQDEPINFEGLSVASSSSTSASGAKYTDAKLITGRPELAAKGIAHFMGISTARAGEIMQKGVEAIREEFERPGTDPEMTAIMHYILDQAAVEQMPGAGGYSGVVQERGNNGKKLVDFLQDPHAVSAELELAHIAALRLYTSDAYTCINGPLRNGCGTAKPHPFAATTLFLSEALKKLRTLNAVNSAEITKRKEFWRGMRVS